MIPKVIHFLFGLSDNFDNMPFSCYHYLAILSAKVINKDYEIVLHYHHEPQNNEWWGRCRQLVKMDPLPSPPTTIHGKTIKQNAHKADWVRVDILAADGGIYLDIDTICIKPFDPLLGSPRKCVMGVEIWNGEITGLCNGVIMTEKGHHFLKLWKDGFVDFDPDDWNKMACRKPLEIAMRYPGIIHIEPSESFFRLTWSPEDLKTMHESVIEFNRSYSQHLWEHPAYKPYLSKVTIEDVLSRDSTYNLMARRLLNEACSQ